MALYRVTKTEISYAHIFISAEDDADAEDVARGIEDENWISDRYSFETEAEKLSREEFEALGPVVFWREDYYGDLHREGPDPDYKPNDELIKKWRDLLFPEDEDTGPEPGDVPAIGYSDDADAWASAYGPDGY